MSYRHYLSEKHYTDVSQDKLVKQRCHVERDLRLRSHQKPFIGHAPPRPTGELTRLLQTFWLDLGGGDPRVREGTHGK